MATTHEFINSDPTKFDSNCSICGGKNRDAIHKRLVTHSFSAWLSTTSFAGTVNPGEQWDTEDAWPSANTMRAARRCYDLFSAGDLTGAEAAMIEAQEPFV